MYKCPSHAQCTCFMDQCNLFTAHLKTSNVLLKRCSPWENAFHFKKEKVICVWKVDYSPVVYIVCTWIKLLTAWNVVRKQWIWIRFCMYSGNGGGYVQMLLDFLSTLIIRVCRLLAENRPCWHLPKHFSGKQVSFEM